MQPDNRSKLAGYPAELITRGKDGSGVKQGQDCAVE